MVTTSMLVFRNRDCLSLFVSNNTTLLELKTLLFLFFQTPRFQIGGVAYLRMRLIHRRLRYLGTVSLMNFIFFPLLMVLKPYRKI